MSHLGFLAWNALASCPVFCIQSNLLPVMKQVRHIGLVLAVVLSMLAPSMACALSGAHLSKAEHACCVQMKGECGKMGMPASHSCCHKEIQAEDFSKAAYLKSNQVQRVVTSGGELLSPVLFSSVIASQREFVELTRTLAHSPPQRITILRI
jgi:hypothetical protein